MLDFDALETSEQGGKFDLTPITHVRRIATKGEHHDDELRVNHELAINKRWGHMRKMKSC